MTDDPAGQWSRRFLSQVNSQKSKSSLTHLDRGCGSKYRGYWRVTPLVYNIIMYAAMHNLQEMVIHC